MKFFIYGSHLDIQSAKNYSDYCRPIYKPLHLAPCPPPSLLPICKVVSVSNRKIHCLNETLKQKIHMQHTCNPLLTD